MATDFDVTFKATFGEDLASASPTVKEEPKMEDLRSLRYQINDLKEVMRSMLDKPAQDTRPVRITDINIIDNTQASSKPQQNMLQDKMWTVLMGTDPRVGAGCRLLKLPSHVLLNIYHWLLVVQHPLTLADQVAWRAAKLPKDSPYRTVIKCDPKPEPPPGDAAARTRQLLAELEKLQAVHPLLQSLDEATDKSVKSLCETAETSEQIISGKPGKPGKRKKAGKAQAVGDTKKASAMTCDGEQLKSQLEVSESCDRIMAAEEALAAELQRLQGNVDQAKEALDEAQRRYAESEVCPLRISATPVAVCKQFILSFDRLCDRSLWYIVLSLGMVYRERWLLSSGSTCR